MRRKSGFTLIEVIIVVAVFAIITALIVPALINSLTLVQRENTMLTMDTNSDRAMTVITSALRPAVIPILTDPDVRDGAKKITRHDTFQNMINSDRGFAKNGKDWYDLLSFGSDMVPFAVPIDYGGPDGTFKDFDIIDADGLLELGITPPTYPPQSATDYEIDYVPVTINGEKAIRHDNYIKGSKPGSAVKGDDRLGIHEYLRHTGPKEFGFYKGYIDDNGSRNAKDAYDALESKRFAEVLEFPRPEGMNYAGDVGYAVIRFVPLEQGGQFVLVEEANIDYDINEDGAKDDIFALGHVEITYPYPAGVAASSPLRVYATGETVLLQMNRNKSSYTPMFKLVRTDSQNRPDTTRRGYAMVIQLFFYEKMKQVSPLAFGKATPFLARKYVSVVEMRNMSVR